MKIIIGCVAGFAAAWASGWPLLASFAKLAISDDVELVTLTPLEPFFFRLKFACAMGLGVGIALLVAVRLPGRHLWVRVSAVILSFLTGMLGALGWILATMDQLKGLLPGEPVRVPLGAVPLVWMPVGGMLGLVLGTAGWLAIRAVYQAGNNESAPGPEGN